MRPTGCNGLDRQPPVDESYYGRYDMHDTPRPVSGEHLDDFSTN
jgi:hypothetical protein